MTSFWKAVLVAAGIAVIFGASVWWLQHKRASVAWKRLSDAATETRTRADQGDVTAEFNLAHMYYEGKGIPLDYAEAARWYRQAADQGYAKAQFNLGDLYFRGQGVPQDYAEAVHWIQKSADQDVAKAQSGLGYMYFNGVGLQRDYAEAVYWYRRAADQGEAVAQVDLGYMYAKGQGVPQDRAEALRWYRKAAENGNLEAKRALETSGSGLGVLTETRWFELATVFLGVPVGLWAILGSLLPGKKLPGWRKTAVTLLGVAFLLNAGLSLYAFAHGTMRYSPHRDAFHLARFVLNAIAVLIIVTAVLPAKKDATSS